MSSSQKVRLVAAIGGSLLLIAPVAGAATGMLEGPTQMSANQGYCC